MEILNKKQKIIIIIIAMLMLLFIGYYIINKVNKEEYIYLETEENESKIDANINQEILNEEKKEIIVHVTGAVKKQGIVKVESGARISDVIDAAGGTINETDLTKINLAYEVEDGQKIYVPNINDKENVNTITEEAGNNVIDNSQKETKKVNINTATQTELETLGGVGPSTALKIINYRNENGKFKKIEELKNVPGIGDAKFESLKDSVCIK